MLSTKKQTFQPLLGRIAPTSEREKLLSVLLKFESLFDGTLGDWNLPLISFELKEGTTPYHSRAYPILQIHKATLMKEIDRLCSIGWNGNRHQDGPPPPS